MKRTVKKKNPIDPVTTLAQGAWAILSALQIHAMVTKKKKPVRRKTAKKNPVARKQAAKAPRSVNPRPKVKSHGGTLYVLTISRGDDTEGVYLHDGESNGFSKEFKTVPAAKAWATRNKKRIENPSPAIKRKINGFRSFINRRRAMKEYGRELKLEAKLAGVRKRKKRASHKALKNPVTPARKVAAKKNPAITWTRLKKRPVVWLAKSGGEIVGEVAKAGNTHYECLGKGGRASSYKLIADAKRWVEATFKAAKKNPVRAAAKKKNPAVKKQHVSVGATCKCRHTFSEHYPDTGQCARLNCYCQKFTRKTAKKKNPATSVRRKTYEMFQGRRVEKVNPMPVSRHAGPRPKMDQLGGLVELKLADGRVIKTNPRTFRLCAMRGRMWIVGGKFAKADANQPARVLNPFDHVDHVVYETHKPHHGDAPGTHYIHKLGEEGGLLPLLCVDNEGFPVLKGGSYKIRREGIRD